MRQDDDHPRARATRTHTSTKQDAEGASKQMHLLPRTCDVSFSQRAQSSCSTRDNTSCMHHVDYRALNRTHSKFSAWRRARSVRAYAHG